MSSRDPIIGYSTKKRFIHHDLMVWKNAREATRDDSLVETRAKLSNPSRDLEGGEFCHLEAPNGLFILRRGG